MNDNFLKVSGLILIILINIQNVVSQCYFPDYSFGKKSLKAEVINQPYNLGDGYLFHDDQEQYLIEVGEMRSTDLTENYKCFVRKFNYSGDLDMKFGTNGIFIFDPPGFNSVNRIRKVLYLNHAIYCMGNDNGPGKGKIYIQKITAKGSFDSSFGTNGQLSIDLKSHSIPSGQIVCMNSFDTNFIVVAANLNGGFNDSMIVFKINLDGKYDPNFGENGYKFYSRPYTQDYQDRMTSLFAVAPDEKGITLFDLPYLYSPKFLMYRIKLNGTPDSSYGYNGLSQIQYLSVGDHGISPEVYTHGTKFEDMGYYITWNVDDNGKNLSTITKVKPFFGIDSSFGYKGTVGIKSNAGVTHAGRITFNKNSILDLGYITDASGIKKSFLICLPTIYNQAQINTNEGNNLIMKPFYHAGYSNLYDIIAPNDSWVYVTYDSALTNGTSIRMTHRLVANPAYNKYKDFSLRNSMKVLPNPVRIGENIIIRLPENILKSEIKSCQIFDLLGNLIFFQAHLIDDNGQLIINSKILKTGFYVIRLETQKGQHHSKINVIDN